MTESSANGKTEIERGTAGDIQQDRLRVAGIGAAVVGGILSLGLTLYAGRGNLSLLLQLLFAGWVVLPFVGLVLAHLRSNRWPSLARKALFAVTILIVLISLVGYGGIIGTPEGSPRAFAFVVVPGLSWGLMIVTLISSAILARRVGR